MKQSAKRTSTLLSAALVATLGLSQSAHAEQTGPLFSAIDLSHGYMATAGEGKCGEGKCGADKQGGAEKDSEGKCGEGKCGADAGGDKTDGEGKCGEGKCGTAA
jgi:uncharacterized low-complexity protein